MGKILPILSSNREDFKENVKYLKQSVRSSCIPNNKVKICEIWDRNHEIVYGLNIFNMGWKLVEDFKMKNDKYFFHDRFDLILDRFIEIQKHNFSLFVSLQIADKITIDDEVQIEATISHKQTFKVLAEYKSAIEKNIVEFAPFQKIFEHGKKRESTSEKQSES